MVEQTSLDVDVEPIEIRSRHDVEALCQHLGLGLVDELSDDSWQLWRDPAQWVTVRFDAGPLGPFQVHVSAPGAWFVSFCYRGFALPTRCVRTAIEDVIADARARGIPDARDFADQPDGADA